MAQLCVQTIYGQDPAYADPRTGTLVNAIVRITPEIPDVSTPLNIIWVQDRSGSMKGEKLKQSKTVLKKLIDGLDRNDRAGVIAFNQEHEIIAPLKTMRAHYRRMAKIAVKRMGAKGATRLSAPLLEAVSLKDEESQIPRTVVMLTDGLSQCGSVKHDEEQLIRAAQKLYREGGRLIMIGIGADYNSDLLERVCEAGPDFEMFHVSTTNPAEIDEVTREVMCELRSASIGNLQIAGQVARGVELKSVTSFTPTQRPHEVKRGKFSINSGSLSKHRGQHLLFEMLVKNPKVGSRNLMTLAMKGVRRGDSVEEISMSHVLSLRFTTNPKDAVKQTEKEVQDCIIRAEAHRKMKNKLYDVAAHLYEMIGDTFMAQQARKAERQAARGGLEAIDAHRTITTGSVGSTRAVSRDWSTREC